jgi:hypothetical protein
MTGLMRRAASDPVTLALSFFSIRSYGCSSHLVFYLSLYIRH